MEYLVVTQNLMKEFNGVIAVDHVNLHIKRGEIYGLLGPNGSGKTTLMKLLMNLLKPEKGSMEIFGEPLKTSSYSFFRRIGSIIESPVFYDKLSALENLQLHCRYMGYHNEDDIQEALDMVTLTGIKEKKVREFSLGMKQRLAIARAILTKPEFLILDEPINGLDPIGIIEIRDLLKRMNREYGITILMSSHILSEIEHIADTVGILDQGKLLQETLMDDLKNNYGEYVELKTSQIQKAAYLLTEKLNMNNFKTMDSSTIRIYELGVDPERLFRVFMDENVIPEAFTKKSSSLEEYFLSLIRKQS